MGSQSLGASASEARNQGRKTTIVANCAPEWWRGLDPFDAAFHVATCLESLLWGVEDEDTLVECQNAGEIWMKDLRRLRGELRDE